MSKMQPLVISKTKSGKFVGIFKFSTTNDARVWLRSEGCTFRNDNLTSIGNDSVILRTDEYEYEVEVAALKNVQRVRRESYGEA